MAIQRIETNRRMSQAVKAGSTVYIAGQLAYESGGETGGADVARQMEEILGRVDRLLAEFGGDRTSLVSATLWLEDIGDYDRINAVWDAWVPDGHAPARACVQAKLAMAGYRVEMAAVAVVAV